MVFRPMNQDQFASMQLGLTRDASSETAALEFGIWTAQFRNRQAAATTDLVIVSTRSEEHTSELQSLAYLVCRLLLEKKNRHPDALGTAGAHHSTNAGQPQGRLRPRPRDRR